LTFVGHASLLLEEGDVSLLLDPWLVGDAFNEAWAPWPAPVLGPDQLARVTHLWVSHEHPDHLSIPTLRSIPPERRAAITALYQHHWSDEVATFLRSLGFADVVELHHGQPVRLGSQVVATLHQVGHEDAALTVSGERSTVMDLNDAKPSDAKLRRLRQEVGPIDVLVDQFSIAGWPGNPDDGERHRRVAASILDGVARHVELLDPARLVPAASFVRFVSPENCYLNDLGNRLADVVARIGADRTAVMYPGDTWDLDEPWGGTGAALERHEASPPLPPGGLRTHAPKALDEVVVAAEEGVASLRAAYHRPLLRRLAPVTFHLTDLDERVLVDLEHGVRVLGGHEASSACVVVTSSQAAWYAFGHRWGLTTLAISGRLQVHGDERAFTRLKQLGAAASSGFRSRGVLGDALRPRGRTYLRRRWRDVVPELVGRAS
jgi:hypothetical protein